MFYQQWWVREILPKTNEMPTASKLLKNGHFSAGIGQLTLSIKCLSAKWNGISTPSLIFSLFKQLLSSHWDQQFMRRAWLLSSTPIFFSHKHFVGDPSCLNDQPVLITRPSLSVTRKFIIKDASEQKQKEKRCFRDDEREIRAAKLGKKWLVSLRSK